MEQFLPPADSLTIKYTLIAVLLPLAAAVINWILPGRTNKLTGWVSSSATLVSSVLSGLVFSRIWNVHAVHSLVHWFTIGTTQLDAGILLNNLSVLMLLLVNLIALPVQLYSIAYMGHDDGFKRYFTYLSFFCFSMLALVVADNLVTFYIFWELVGFSSYLLIGFWFTRDRAVMANKKAFIMNRIGDIGLFMAIIIIFTQFHTFDLDKLFGSGNLLKFSSIHAGKFAQYTNTSNAIIPLWLRAYVVQLPDAWHYIAFAGIFLAVAAKSAQFPLHTWLPDAMEGPTSVSALIHAATMVAAGVFLLARVYPFFGPVELTILAVTGCCTAFMAATIALAQNDLKRILAYSTISQLGYMVMAMGVGAYSSSLFHLVTHAFFKCLLFLVAGVVIHQVAHIRDDNQLAIDPQNIQFMGGLRKKLPFTFIMAIIGGIALAGLPLTSGFLSKDGILVQSFEWAGGKNPVFELVPVFAVLTALLTAFYITRMLVKVFFGELRIAPGFSTLKINIDDGHWLYKLPMALLALGCFFPLFSANPLSAGHSWLLGGFQRGGAGEGGFAFLVPAGVTIFSLPVIYYAWAIYTNRRANPFPQRGILFDIACREWYFDAIYERVIIKPILFLGRACFWTDRRVIDGFIILFAKLALAFSRLAAFTDREIIDGFINLLVKLVRGIGNLVRLFQGGRVQYYLYSMLMAIAAIFILKIFF